MSVHASAWAWEQADLAPVERLTLLALADRANTDGGCWPKLTTLADQVGSSRSTVKRAVERLVARGLVVSTPRYRADGSRSTNLYTLAMQAPTFAPAPADDPPVQNDPGSGQNDPGPVHLQTRGPGHLGGPTEPSREPSENTSSTEEERARDRAQAGWGTDQVEALRALVAPELFDVWLDDMQPVRQHADGVLVLAIDADLREHVAARYLTAIERAAGQPVRLIAKPEPDGVRHAHPVAAGTATRTSRETR